MDELATASRAVSAAEGWLTAAPPGVCGLAVAPSRAATWAVALTSVVT